MEVLIIGAGKKPVKNVPYDAYFLKPLVQL